MDWPAVIFTTLAAGFTLQNGEKLVHSSLLFNVDERARMYDGWAFHPLNPWLERLEPFLFNFIEMGLQSEAWQERAR